MQTPEITAPRDLFTAAQDARERAYAPYSGCRVGAAIRTRSGDIFAGCNVENASYGATICAERAAVMGAVSAQGKIEITEVCVVTDALPPWPPCGMCRQVLAEFGPEARVWWASVNGMTQTATLRELLPATFSGEYLATNNALLTEPS